MSRQDPNATLAIFPSAGPDTLPVRRELSELARVVRWVHSDDGGELLSRVRDLAGDLHRGRPPVVAASVDADGQFVAACYFRELPGRVADLGGLRVSGTPSETVHSIVRRLIEHCQSELGRRRIEQIQAVLSQTEWSTRKWLELCGFELGAKVERRLLELPQAAPALLRAVATPGGPNATKATKTTIPVRAAHTDRPPSIRGRLDSFVQAAAFSASRLADLLGDTFAGTLDCPLLNALRTPEDFLASFLDSEDLHPALPWWVYLHDGCPAGCVLLKRHSADVVELAYMGLGRRFRGRGLGQVLVQHAIDQSTALGANLLIAAVDANNTPAVRTYAGNGFRVLDNLCVLFPRRILQRHRAVA